MLFTDPITITIRGVVNPKTGDRGPDVVHQARGTFVPVSAEDYVAYQTLFKTASYRVVTNHPAIEGSSFVTWRGVSYTVQGKAMAYRMNGRAHHWEVVVTAA